MSPRHFRIRDAAAEDLPAVIGLVRALADFEHLPGPDESAAERLGEHAFGTSPCVQILVADEAEEVVGYAVYFMTYSTFLARPSLYLEDLFVHPSQRRRGIATAFLRKLAAIAVARGCGRFEWAVLDWNAPAQDFYALLGAKILPEWRICRLDGPALLELGASLKDVDP